MKTTLPIVLLTAVLQLPVGSTRAASIGVNFLGDGGVIQRWQLAPTDLAGVLVQSNWNNVTTTPAGNVGLSDLLLDNNGNYTAVQLRYLANDAWNSDGPIATPNDRLMKGIIKEGNGTVDTTMYLSFTNLPAGVYDVYLYGNVNGGPVDLDVSIGAVTNYWTEPAAFDEGTGFAQASSSDPNARAPGNYAKFLGVSPVAGTITVAATYRAGSDGLGIAGLQLVTAGTFPSNTIPVSILQAPQSTVGATGGTATFLVWAGGPGPKYQWYKNGVLITGATGSSYSTPILHRSDDGSRYKVTVHNNVNSVTSPEAVLTVMDDLGTRIASAGVSFLGDSDTGDVEPWRLARSEAAGVLLQTNWNNLPTTPSGNVGSSDLLLDNVGHFTAVQLAFSANDAWNSDGPVDTPNDKLMKGLLKQGDGTMALTFTNLAPAFYDVYVYGNVNLGPADLDVSIGPVTNYWTEPAAYDDGTGFLLANSTNPNNRGIGNYLKFASVTPASGTITVLATYQGGGDGLGIAAVQLAASAALPTNALPVVINGQPRGVIAAPGTTATFMVWAGGPFAGYQWSRNGVPIAGATGSSYTTAPVNPSDNGTQYRVTVANNVNSVSSDLAVLTVTNDPGTRVGLLGVSFLGDCDGGDVEPWRLAPTDMAGVLPQTHWNNVATTPTLNVGVSDVLVDSQGHQSAVQISYNANDAWNSDGPFDTPNARLMKGVIKEGNGEIGTTMTLSFTNLAAAFYDVYVYGDVNDGLVLLSVNIGDITNYWFEPAAFDEASGFVQSASTDPNNPVEGNYVKFGGVTPAGGQIVIAATYLGGSDGLGIAGVQLNSSVAFPSMTTLTPRLEAAVQGGQLVLSWNSPASFQLQSRANLTQGNWTSEPTPPVVVLEQHTVRLPAAGPARFFRLLGR